MRGVRLFCSVRLSDGFLVLTGLIFSVVLFVRVFDGQQHAERVLNDVALHYCHDKEEDFNETEDFCKKKYNFCNFP